MSVIANLPGFLALSNPAAPPFSLRNRAPTNEFRVSAMEQTVYDTYRLLRGWCSRRRGWGHPADPMSSAPQSPRHDNSAIRPGGFPTEGDEAIGRSRRSARDHAISLW